MYSQLSWSTLPLAQTNLLPGLRSIWFRGQAQVESKMHSMRPIPAEDGQFGDPIQKHQVKFHYQLVMEFSMILCTVVSDIYIYIRYRYRVYIYITYIPNQENMANQHPINKMTQISQTFSDAASACHWPSPDVAPVIITRFPRISTSTSSPKPAVVVACHATSEAVFFGMCSAAEISKSSAEFRMRVW